MDERGLHDGDGLNRNDCRLSAAKWGHEQKDKDKKSTRLGLVEERRFECRFINAASLHMSDDQKLVRKLRKRSTFSRKSATILAASPDL